MEVVDSINIDKFFYRVSWYHKKLKQVFFGSWQKFDLDKNNFEWIELQNKKYNECFHWMEGCLLKDSETFHDLVKDVKRIHKNIDSFTVNQKKINIVDISSNLLDTYVYM